MAEDTQVLLQGCEVGEGILTVCYNKSMAKEKLLLLAVGLLVIVLGAAYLADGRLLKTQVAPGGGGATAKDWHSISAPGLRSAMVGPTEFCPSPTPTAYLGLNNAGVGQVLGEERPAPSVEPTALSCPEGFVAEGFNEYKLVIDGHETRRESIDGLDPGYILTAVCQGNPSPPGCEKARACAWMWFESSLPVNIELTGLYKKVSGLYKLVESAYIYPDGLNHPETREQVPGVYPSPPNPEELPAWLAMSLWKLSSGDEQTLREHHPKLLEVAQRQISGRERHEKVHWGIFERYLSYYVDTINSPWYDTDWSVTTVEALRDLIESYFKSGWQAVAVLERAEHDAFDEQEQEREVEQADLVPYDGLDDIYCDYMEDMVGMFSLMVQGKGQGYAKADYPIGRRVISCDDYCTTEYFTGADIKIEARPKAGYKFREWQSPVFDKPCAGCAGSKNPVCTLRIGSKGDGCKAVFDPIEVPTPTGATGTPSPS